MNRKYILPIAAVLLVGLVFTTMLATAQEAEPIIQWEYHATRLPGWISSTSDQEKIEAKLNELGAAGWELVGFEERSCILKRPVN